MRYTHFISKFTNKGFVGINAKLLAKALFVLASKCDQRGKSLKGISTFDPEFGFFVVVVFLITV